MSGWRHCGDKAGPFNKMSSPRLHSRRKTICRGRGAIVFKGEMKGRIVVCDAGHFAVLFVGNFSSSRRLRTEICTSINDSTHCNSFE